MWMTRPMWMNEMDNMDDQANVDEVDNMIDMYYVDELEDRSLRNTRDHFYCCT